MFDSPDLLMKMFDWATIPVTALLGLLGFHYKKTVDQVRELDQQIDKLEIHGALNHKDIVYIKQACDQITKKLEKIETEIRNYKS